MTTGGQRGAGGLRVVVVGGGLAGMAATVALASAGAHVTLVEARKSLGGRAGSFEDPQTGESLDNCQHVLLGCCTNLLDFYRRLGVLDRIDFQRTIVFADGRGRLHRLRGVAGIPAPLHLAGALARFGALGGAERASVMGAMLAMARVGRRGREALADVPFGDWLAMHRQSPELVEKFFEPILASALNEHAAIASAQYAIQVFQEAMLANRAGYVMGVPACPLGELYARLPAGEVRLGQRIDRLQTEADRITAASLTSGEVLPANAIVLATGHQTAAKLIPQPWAARDGRLAGLEALESVPILGAHLWFDRPVMSTPHAALLSGPLQWLFRKDTAGRAVHGVISAARECVGVAREELVRRFEEQIRSVLPWALQARVERSVVVIEKRATFSPRPGVDRHRPGQSPPAGSLANLYLAGDYTQTGWPATMEGAVRSGYLAAEAVMRAHGAPARFIAPDLELEWPARVMGMR